jgi:hypothetical protein
MAPSVEQMVQVNKTENGVEVNAPSVKQVDVKKEKESTQKNDTGGSELKGKMVDIVGGAISNSVPKVFDMYIESGKRQSEEDAKSAEVTKEALSKAESREEREKIHDNYCEVKKEATKQRGKTNRAYAKYGCYTFLGLIGLGLGATYFFTHRDR